MKLHKAAVLVNDPRLKTPALKSFLSLLDNLEPDDLASMSEDELEDLLRACSGIVNSIREAQQFCD